MSAPQPPPVDVDLSAAGELAEGMARIRQEFPNRFDQATGTFLRFVPGRESGFAIGEDGTISYARRSDAFRALGIVWGSLASTGHVAAQAQASAFTDVSVMLDVSRNAVLRPDTAVSLLARMALMGITGVWLYMEDTYEVSGEPMFGYFRGRYSPSELVAIDDAAEDMGIEVVPCIQTLGHLSQVLQWPAYRHLQDVDGVLLAGEPETYTLLRKMIAAASSPFRSNRIHLGMDEAHGIGTGTYARRHEPTPAFDILNTHLARVLGICDELRLRPAIWSDMYFRLASSTGQYYDRAATIPAGVADAIPDGVQLVYWDYYHDDQDFYAEWIDRHRQLGKEPIFAGGIWTWNRFWAQLPKSISQTASAMNAARDRGIAEVAVTLWGDDGAECDVYSALPGLQVFADNAYQSHPDTADTEANFLGSAGGTFAEWVAAADLDVLPGYPGAESWRANPSKWLLWHDPVLGFLDADIPAGLAEHYTSLARRLTDAARSEGDDRLVFPAKLATALALKVELHTTVKDHYRAGDADAIRDILDLLLPELDAAVRALWATHRRMWRADNKPFGFDVIERRYGGLLARLDALTDLLTDWLAHRTDRIEEFDTPAEHIVDLSAAGRPLRYRQAASATVVA